MTRLETDEVREQLWPFSTSPEATAFVTSDPNPSPPSARSRSSNDES